MKKSSIMCIICVGIVFIAGCIGEEKEINSKSSMDSQTNQKSDSQTPDLIIKQSDVPGLALSDFKFISVPKNIPYYFTSQQKGSVIETKETKVPVGNRNVGQVSSWIDHQTQREVGVIVKKFDADKTVGLDFSQQNYFVQITVVDKTEKSLDEAMRIAKIIDNKIRKK